MKIKNVFRAFYLCNVLLLVALFLLPNQSAIAQNQEKDKVDANQAKKIIKSGDKLDITVSGYEDYSKAVVVNQNGTIRYLSFPNVKATDLTVEQLKSQLEYLLQPYVTSPDIQIKLVEEETILKAGDSLNIIVKNNEKYNKTVKINESGKISYMGFGELQAGGLTVSQIKASIEKILNGVIFDPQVTVSTLADDYVIKQGDVLFISVKNHEEYGAQSTVQKDGQIYYPTIGYLKAENRTIDMLQREIKDKLSAFVPDAEVKVSATSSEPVAEQVTVEEKKEVEKKEIYQIVPGDIIDIFVKGNNDYNIMLVVEANGRIQYKDIGELKLAGLTEDESARIIESKLRNYIDNPQVTVKVKGQSGFADVEIDKILEYQIKPGDIVSVSIDDRNNYNSTMVVQSNGIIYYPPLGNVLIAGKTLRFLSDLIMTKLPFKIQERQINIGIKELKEMPYMEAKDSEKPLLRSQIFGHDFFLASKNKILESEKIKMPESTDTEQKTKDAISGFVGPTDMVDTDINATVPEKYILRPKDKITLTYWSESDVQNQKIEPIIVDENGEVYIDRIGKMVVRGMTLTQFEEAVKAGLSRVAYKDLKLYATLDKLRSIQIFITGEVFRPGSYAVSSVTTLFNALYTCGGPSDNGSLRNIKLIRTNETKSVDFYKFLMSGDSTQDFDLNNGDTILIPQAEKIVTITGELKRPAIYELRQNENLKELIEIAGGLRPTGFLQRIKIDSVDPSRKRVVLDVDLSSDTYSNTQIHDGDTVTVFSIPSERINTVTVEGKVEMPGVYQLKEGMKVSELINVAQGVLGEAYMQRADLLRLNTDKRTATLIPIDLSKALSGDKDNDMLLKQWDKLVVYSKWDIKWTADRVVSVHGAIHNPGSYERPDGMKIYDLLIKAGGLLRNAYPEQAYLMRFNEKGELAKRILINLSLAMNNDSANNIELEDGDSLLIYTYQEANWKMLRYVIVTGAVQRAGTYARTDGMKISELVKMAGNLLPDTFPYRALLLRRGEKMDVTQGFFINLKLALEDDSANNLEIKDGDELIVYKYREAKWEPERMTSVSGAVQNPDSFPRTDNMKVLDLLYRAGGVLPTAYLDRADLYRFGKDWETYEAIPINIGKVLSGDESANIILQDGDLLKISTIKEAIYMPDNIVTIYGAVQRPDTYIKSIKMKLSDLLFLSGGLLPGVKNAEISRISENGRNLLIPIDIIALNKGDMSKDLDLMDKDVIFVRKERNYLERLQIVILKGEISYPGEYAIKQNERLSDLIKRAGGITDNAYPEASTVSRVIDNLLYEEQKKSIRQVGNLFSELSDQEYQREYAEAMLKSNVTNMAKTNESQASESGSTMANMIGLATGLDSVAQIQKQLGVASSTLEEAKKEQITIVTPARKLNSLLPSGRLIIDISSALKNPGSKDDISLNDGDIIIIPPKSSTISVTGAVIQPSSLVFDKDYKIKDYISMSGGYSTDADKNAIYVVRANGLVISGQGAKIVPGDVIVVPTKVMKQKVTDRWGQVFGIIRFAVGALAMVYAIKYILG